MADLEKVLASLSPEKRALLEKKLKQKGKSFNSFPLSYSQRRLWFLDKLDKGSTTYTIPAAMKLTGNLNIDFLKKSFVKIIERHEVLRSKIVTIKEEPVQVVTKNITLDFKQINLSNSEQKDKEFKQALYDDVAIPFSLNDEKLFRIALYKFYENEYVLTLLMHHIISDGWSVGIFIHELTEIYNSLLNAKEPILPELTIQYADFAKWQQKWQNSPNFKQHLEYWKDKLKSTPEKLQLPLDYSRPLMKRFNGKIISSKINKNITEKIASFIKEENVTMFMFLISVYNVVLNKITGQNDLTVGTPIANRNKSEVENLIGFFVNTLAIRSEVNDNENFVAYLQTVKSILLEAYSHQEIPFEYLVEVLNPERDLSTTPLFQTMFVFQGLGNQKLNLADVEVSQYPIENTTAKFDLTLMITEIENGEMLVSFEYDTDLFSPKTVERFVSYYKKCLKEIVEIPTKKIKDISILSKNEYEDLIFKRNETEREFPSNKTLSQLLEEEASASPNLIAVNYEGETITYGEFNAKANQLAYHLIANDIRLGDVVGIYMTSSIETIVSIFAVLKTGAVYLPLDPHYPDERIMFMISDGNAKIIIHNIDVHESIRKENIKTIEVSRNSKIFNSDKVNNLKNNLHSEIVAYIIYTSGSTGKPKGIICNHKGVVNNILDCNKRSKFVKGAKHSLWTTINFDVSVSEIFGALITGGELHIVPLELRPFEWKFFEWLENHKIQRSYIPPFMLNNLAKQLEEKKIKGYFDRLLVGVEPIKNEILYSLNKSLPSCSIFNGYGPTETTMYSTVQKYNKAVNDSEIVPIGFPIPNTKIFLLDKNLQPVPSGVIGEIYIQSIGIAHGYVNRPDLTAERFIANPFSKVPGERMYRTGDLAKYLPDGSIKFSGRADTQIKIRGFRVELGEIENELLQLKEIKKAIVLAKENENSGKVLVAYIILQDGVEKDDALINKQLSETLPDYMVPSIFIYLEEFPVLPNGKVDKKSLPIPNNNLIDSQYKYVAPSTDTEIKITAIICDVLNREKVGIKDNFFAIGGHSLMATRVITRIKDELKVELPLKFIFEKPTIEDLAKEVDSDDNSLNEIKLEKLSEGQKKQLSFAQERLWFLDQLEPGNSAYNIPSVIKLTGKINLEVFDKSLNEIVKRHEVLRTSIETIDGRAVLKIKDEINFSIDIIELNYNPSEEKINSIIKEESFKSFKLNSAPLMRAKMITLNSNESIFILTMHHIISDGWSAGILINEFSEIYKSELIGKRPLLPKLEYQYSDYAAWQKKWLQDKKLEEQISFWKKELDGIPPLIDLPLDKKRPKIQTYNGDSVTFAIDEAITSKLTKIASANSSTLFMMLMSIFHTLLYRYTGQSDICIGSPIANRRNADIEKLIGFFVNTIVIRSRISDDQSFKELLASIRETSLNVFSHQDIPFEKMVDALNIERDVRHSPIFQVMFTLQNLPQNKIETSELVIEALNVHSHIAKYDMNLTVVETPDSRLICSLEYNTDLFEKSSVEKFTKHFSTLTESIVQNPNEKISSLSLLPSKIKNEYITSLNDTLQNVKLNVPVHKIIAQIAAKNPNSTALVFEDKKISYGEFDSVTNKLSNYLVSNGIKVDELVGICVERSFEMMYGLLGILKSGAAYLPIDPTNPKERISFIIKDSEMKYLLTTSKHVPLLNGLDIKLIVLDELDDILDKESDEKLDIKIDEQNIMYCIYTSGSTGVPKGTLVPHKGVVNRLLWMQNEYKINTKDKLLQKTPYTFDVSVWELFLGLMSGATLVIAKPEGHRDGKYLKELIKNNSITIIHFVPPMLRGFLEEENLNSYCESLENVICSGEALSTELKNKFFQDIPNTKLNNLYGPTEASIDVSFWECVKNIEKEIVPIGKPIWNTKLYILDSELNIVPTGVIGELYIGGVSLARGYLNRADLTSSMFIPDPFSNVSGSRLYRTGDLVRYLKDGSIQYLGRKDNQVKIRGLRIELGEIEEKLKEYETIIDAVVTVYEDQSKTKKIVSYYVEVNDQEIETKILRDYLLGTLPEYMIPTYFIKLEKIPLNSNGKVDRKKLPTPKQSDIKVSTKYEPANTEREKILVEAVQQVLGVNKVGIHDNFFELGGDSIIGIQVISKAKQAGLFITPVQLFQHQTIYKLALAAKEVEVVKAEQGIVSGEFDLTPIQKSFIEQNYSNPNYWNQSVLFKVNKNLEEKILNDVILKLLEHHDALRIRVGNNRQNIIVDFKDIPFEYIDLTEEENKIDEIIENKCQETQSALNIVDGPIFKVVYFRLGNDEGRILFVFHHFVIDGVSWRIILEDFQMLYTAFEKNAKFKLPAKTTSFKEWSEELVEFSNGNDIKEEKEFWLSYANNFTDTTPRDLPDGINSESSTENISISLDEEQTKLLLQDVNKKFNTKINDILLTALVRSYSTWTGKRKMFVQLEGHGRDELLSNVDITRTVGWFTSLYPLELDLKKSVEIGDSIKTIKEEIRKIPNNGIGYGILRYVTDDKELQNKLHILDSVEIMFNYLGQFDNILDQDSLFQLAKENKGFERDQNNLRSVLIDVSGNVINNQLRLNFGFSKNIFKKESIEEWAKYYLKEIKEIIKFCTEEGPTKPTNSYTSSDFGLTNLNDDKLNKVLAKLGKKK